MNAVQAIVLSQREDRVVTLKWSSVLETDLFAACNDTAETETVMEFWGIDDAGEWRVHLATDRG